MPPTTSHTRVRMNEWNGMEWMNGWTVEWEGNIPSVNNHRECFFKLSCRLVAFPFSLFFMDLFVLGRLVLLDHRRLLNFQYIDRSRHGQHQPIRTDGWKVEALGVFDLPVLHCQQCAHEMYAKEAVWHRVNPSTSNNKSMVRMKQDAGEKQSKKG